MREPTEEERKELINIFTIYEGNLPKEKIAHDTPDYVMILTLNGEDEYILWTDILKQTVNVRGKFGPIISTVNIGFNCDGDKNKFRTQYKEITEMVANKIDNIKLSNKEIKNPSDFINECMDLVY
jgi:hypothetical protein